MIINPHHAALSGTGSMTDNREISPSRIQDIQDKSRELAGVFYGMMVRTMEESIESMGGYGEDMMKTVRSTEVGKVIAAQEGDPLSRVIETALTRRVDPGHRPTPYTRPWNAANNGQNGHDPVQDIANKIRQIVDREKIPQSGTKDQRMIGGNRA